eukprot:TRINITY_DN22304_c0_g1_i1.p1 TRINITY_DN22304_c0_g1~~TRINITY_DN22304_c0_g1_i1.p1  ORF type:complete len:336 (+),score=18.04 TRINITY_DN22304_c0_g1_i1:63-1070(+)
MVSRHGMALPSSALVIISESIVGSPPTWHLSESADALDALGYYLDARGALDCVCRKWAGIFRTAESLSALTWQRIVLETCSDIASLRKLFLRRLRKIVREPEKEEHVLAYMTNGTQARVPKRAPLEVACRWLLHSPCLLRIEGLDVHVFDTKENECIEALDLAVRVASGILSDTAYEAVKLAKIAFRRERMNKTWFSNGRYWKYTLFDASKFEHLNEHLYVTFAGAIIPPDVCVFHASTKLLGITPHGLDEEYFATLFLGTFDRVACATQLCGEHGCNIPLCSKASVRCSWCEIVSGNTKSAEVGVDLYYRNTVLRASDIPEVVLRCTCRSERHE